MTGRLIAIVGLPIVALSMSCVRLDRSEAPAPRRGLQPAALRSGDLVFRVGTGWRADAVRFVSRSSLSHVGIVVRASDGVHVVHAEPPGEDGPGGVVEQTLDRFASPRVAAAVVVYRRIDTDCEAGRRVAAAAETYARRRIPFDDRFDLEDGKAFYCTELVLRASRAAGVPLAAGRTTIAVGVLAGRYVLPSDLLTTGVMRRVD